MSKLGFEFTFDKKSPPLGQAFNANFQQLEM